MSQTILPMISVVILTLNEEKNLPGCLASVQSCDDIVVLDSGSTDRTSEIAKANGARVFTHSFLNFGAQRNHAQTEIPFQHHWVFHLDADEHMTPELWKECLEVTDRNDPEIDGYWVAPKMIFEGHWIPRCTDYPAYQARLVRVPDFQFIQVGHGQREASEMRLAPLTQNYLHDLSSDGEAVWLEKHRRYAAEEAAQHQANTRKPSFNGLFSRDSLARRRTLKQLSYQLPFRPDIRFIYQYILRGGFLHGIAGFKYCLLLRRYEQFVNAALRKPPASSA